MRHSRSARLWLTSQPSRRSSTRIRGEHQLGRTAAIFPMLKSWPHAQLLLPGPDGQVADRRPRRAQHAARASLRHPVDIACVPDQPTALAGCQTFSEAHPAGSPCQGSGRRPDASTWHSRPRAASAGAPPQRPSAELLHPPVAHLLGHAEPTADLRDRLARRLLCQGVRDPLFRNARLSHANLRLCRRPHCPRLLAAGLTRESGGRPGENRVWLVCESTAPNSESQPFHDS